MSPVDVVAGIDTGTSGCKVTVLDEHGTILATAFRGYPTHHLHPGWAEQDPADWVRAAHATLSEALNLSAENGGPTNLRGLSFSAPHHVAVLCDEDMNPLRRAIMWTDQRSAVIAQETTRSHGELIWQRCGNAPAATWTLPQMQWLQSQEPHVLRATRRVLFMKDFVRHSFCPAHVTDHVDASGTLLFDVNAGSWVPELLELAGLSASAMPRVVAPGEVVGNLPKDVADSLGAASKVLVLTGSADTAAELLAAGAVSPGDHTLKLATAGNVSHVEQTPSPNALDAISYPYLIPGTYYLNSATNSAAASFEWLARIMASDPHVGREFFEQLDQEASGVQAGSDGLTFHPYLTGERAPHWNPALRASFVGLTAAHGRGHLARSVMEGVAMSMREARGPHAPPLSAATLIGGGAKSEVWAGIMAAVFRAELRVPSVADSSLGGALLAATELGWLTDLSATPTFLGVASTQHPADQDAADAYDHAFSRYQRIQQALQPGYDADHRS